MADNKDLFAPPSQEELDIFAPPSETELSSFKQVAQPEQKDKTSILEAAKTFGLEGASRGFDDELGGTLEAAGQFVGIKGLGAPSISETELNTDNALNLNKLLENYRSARDRRRAIKEQQRADRPGTALASNIVGGIVPIPGSSPVLEGAMAGLGSSEADLTKGEVGKAALDIGLGAGIGKVASKVIPAAPTAAIAGAGTGALIGGGMALADENATGEDAVNKLISGGLIGGGVGALGGAGLSKLGKVSGTLLNKITASTGLQQGFKKGLEGTDITSPEYGDQVYSGIKNLTDDVTKPILDQKMSEEQFAQNAKNLFETQKSNTVKHFETEVDDLIKSFDDFKQADVARQAADKQGELDQLTSLTTKVADEFDSKLMKMEKQIGKDIEAVYAEAGDKFQTPVNLIDVVEGFKASLPQGFKPTGKMQTVLDASNGDVSLKDSKQLRDLFWSLRSDQDSTIRNAARESYYAYNNKVQSDLAMLNPDLGAALQMNNAKWSSAAKVRDNFINYKDDVESGANAVLKLFDKTQMTPNSKAKVLARSEAERKLRSLMDQLREANPQVADEIQSTGTAFGKRLNSAADVDPVAPAMPVDQASRLSELQAKLAQAKSTQFQAPQVDAKFTQFNDDPLNIAQKFMNYLQKGQEEKEGLALKEEMDTFFKDLSSTKGEEFANTVKSEMGRLSDDYKIYTPELKLSDVFTKAGIGRTVLKTSAVTGNKLGQGAKAVIDSPVGQGFKKAALIGDNVISYLSPDNVIRLRNSPDKTSQALATMLEKIQSMPKAKQNAAIFAISQNPVYRSKLNTEEDKR